MDITPKYLTKQFLKNLSFLPFKTTPRPIQIDLITLRGLNESLPGLGKGLQHCRNTGEERRGAQFVHQRSNPSRHLRALKSSERLALVDDVGSDSDGATGNRFESVSAEDFSVHIAWGSGVSQVVQFGCSSNEIAII